MPFLSWAIALAKTAVLASPKGRVPEGAAGAARRYSNSRRTGVSERSNCAVGQRQRAAKCGVLGRFMAFAVQCLLYNPPFTRHTC